MIDADSALGDRPGIPPTQCVSFPRSGHHLLTRCLQSCFGSALGYCPDVRRRRDFAKFGVNYQKNHDFDLALPVERRFRYVVQYRYPLESIASWYRWELEWGVPAEHNHAARRLFNRVVPIWRSHVRRDTPKRWDEFVERRLPFWRGFVRKWLIGRERPPACHVAYKDFVARPTETVARVAAFLAPGRAPDPYLVRERIDAAAIAPRSRLEDFPHFDRGRFAALEWQVRPELDALDLPLRYQ